MAKRKFKINIFDVFVVFVLILFGLIFLLSNNNKLDLGNKKVLVDVVINDQSTIENIKNYVKNGGQVFYNSTKYPVTMKSYLMQYSPNSVTMHLTLEGYGDISDNNMIFNGQRIFANQKVEIRSDFFAQGRVVKVYYANN